MLGRYFFLNTLPYFEDTKAMRNYAKEKGVSIASLSASEKEQFTKANSTNKKASSYRKSIPSTST